MPRDRESSYEPRIVKKRQKRLSGVDEMVISLAAKGLTTGEVQAHLAEVYGADGPGTIRCRAPRAGREQRGCTGFMGGCSQTCRWTDGGSPSRCGPAAWCARFSTARGRHSASRPP